MNPDEVLKEELIAYLGGGNAHMNFDDAVSEFPMDGINERVPHGSYTVWQLLAHMRIAQRDILEFIRNPEYVSPDFPEGYWPRPDEKATPEEWEKTVEGIRNDLAALIDIVKDPKTDFFGPIPHARGYTIFREILLAGDHNAYHVGELVSIRRILNLNPVKEY
ncbi:MAG TPA: DinB family protein [Deltaproteobacteria bacterium]|jgi:hypothetical protein|nr:DinB family protein [Deltaproteobacteria bacterium]